MNCNLKNKTIVITGAGRGIGEKIAEAVATENAAVAILSRSKNELKSVLKKIQINSPASNCYTADVSDLDSLREASSRLLSEFGPIDCLINCAGIQMPIGKFYDSDIDSWTKNIQINLLGTVNAIHLFMDSIIRNGKGKIINFSGGGAVYPRPNFSAYAVAKTGIVRLTEILAYEFKERKIDVNVVAPGAINTKMLDEIIDAGVSAGNEYSEALKRREEGGNDINKVVELVKFLISDYSDGITGKLISAQWDPWDNKDFQNLLRNDTDFGTLRRIDNKNYFKKI